MWVSGWTRLGGGLLLLLVLGRGQTWAARLCIEVDPRWLGAFIGILVMPGSVSCLLLYSYVNSLLAIANCINLSTCLPGRQLLLMLGC